MAKKSIASSARGTRARKSARSIPDSKIDFSDIPELTDEQLGKMKRPGRPLLGESLRQMIAIRIDANVLREIKELADQDGKGYQSLINEILGRYVKRNAA